MNSFSGVLKLLAIRSKQIIWKLGLHAFSLILFFVFVDFIFGGIIFYQYVFWAEAKVPDAAKTILKFDDKSYEQIVRELQLREQENEVVPAGPADMSSQPQGASNTAEQPSGSAY